MSANNAKRKLVFGRLALNAVVVCAFGTLLYLGIQLSLDRQWAVSFLPVALALMLIPFVNHSSSLRERVGVSLIMPFALGGGALFVVLYFQMFHFDWFEAIFNGKGSGPFGLVISVLLGLAAGGYVGFRVIRLTGFFDNARAGRPT